MNSRELVKKTLEFDKPPRTARQLWKLPWAEWNYPKEVAAILADYPPDIVAADAVPLKQTPKTYGEPYKVGEYTDAWGCVYVQKLDGIHGEVKNPVVVGEEWEDFEEKIHIPVEWLTVDIDGVNRFCAETDKFVLMGAGARIFEILQFMRGTENFYADLALDNPGMRRAMRKVHEFNCELFEVWAKTDVDALQCGDDWGSQQSLLINPKTWVEVFKPMYRDYAEIARRHGKKMFMHSDGHILAIYPHLIEIGIDALNSQLFCMDFDKLEQFAGKITFWGEIDRHNILPFGTEEDTRVAVRKVRERLWRNGGCIAQCEFGPGAKPENVRAVFDEWAKG
jgi:uroporphyrinogen-III decarboxylase